jgi:hypothetical protein
MGSRKNALIKLKAKRLYIEKIRGRVSNGPAFIAGYF